MAMLRGLFLFWWTGLRLGVYGIKLIISAIVIDNSLRLDVVMHLSSQDKILRRNPLLA